MSFLDRFRTKKPSDKPQAAAVGIPPLQKGKEEKARASKQTTPAARSEQKKQQKRSLKPAKRADHHLHTVLIRPLVTEKATVTGTYLFEVPLSANKIEVSHAISALYGVAPKHVRTITVHGKSVRFGGRTGSRKTWKKAIVRMPAGKTIQVYEGT